MFIKAREKGQALILIALAAIGLFAFGALAIDGSRVYSDKRHAQNAADAAALAGALAYTRGNDVNNAAQTRATSNGYDSGALNDVTITATNVPSGECPGNTAGKDVTVAIVSYVNTTFARVIGRNQITNAVSATSRACGFYYASLFDGNAIVGLNPSTSSCAFDTGNSNSAHWEIDGGGAFSNGCAWSKNNSSVNLHGGCVTSVGSSSGFTCQNANQTTRAISYPADVLKIMPPNPCDGTPGDIGLPPPAHGSTFSNGVYCISNMDAYDQKDITLDNATLYVTDTDFQLKFAGGGGFYGTPTHAGSYTGSDDYDDYFMIIAYDPAGPCPRFTDHNSQVIEWRGNGSGTFYGTVLAPSACLDVRGNGDPSGMHTQIIGYNVGSNGDADVYIHFEAEENHQQPVFPSISVLR